MLIDGLESGKFLPSLSPIAIRLMELASDDDSSLADIEALIEKDPSLTIRILKLANSVFFRFGNPAKSVRQAVVRIGTRQTRLLALSLMLKDTFPMSKVGAADYRRYWRMSLYQGIAAQSLARQLKTRDAEEAFTAGLTLEIGLLAMLAAFADRAGSEEFPWYPLSSRLQWEKERYGLDHREVGELILTRWKFPASFIVCQKSSSLSRNVDELLPLVRICAMASQMSAFICEPEAGLSEVFDDLELRFGLTEPLIHEVVAGSLREVDEVAHMFELEVGSTRDTEALMRKARDVLSQLSGRLDEGRMCVTGNPSLGAASDAEAGGSRELRCVLESVEREIRGPLRSVGGLAFMLAKSIDPESDQGRYVQFILAETERLEQALDGLDRMFRF